MNQEKREIEGYEIVNAVLLGGVEVLFGRNDESAEPFFVCNCSYDNIFGGAHYTGGVVGDNYLELMQEFASRVQQQIDAVKAERDKISVPTDIVSASQCDSISNVDIENKVVVIRPKSLVPEYRGADNQLCLAVGGFGTSPDARGRAVFTVNLYSGKESRWDRSDIQGTIKPECMPDWAKSRMSDVQKKLKERQSQQRSGHTR